MNYKDKTARAIAMKNSKDLSSIWQQDIIKKPVQRVAVCCTLSNGYNDTNFLGWKSKIGNLDCDIQVSTLEYITDGFSVDFTPRVDLFAEIDRIRIVTGKTISVIKPHIVTYALGDSFVRSGYSPTNKALFFTNWTNRMLAYADYCDLNNIPNLCITCEMAVLTDQQYTPQWIALINAVKATHKVNIISAFTIYELIYQCANLNIVDVLLSHIDVVGVNFYPTLLKNKLMKSLTCYSANDNTSYITIDDLISKCKRLGKQFFITETGCSNYSAGSNVVSPIWMTGSVDYTDMRIYYQTVLEYFANNANIDKVYLWHINTPFDFLDDTVTKGIVSSYYGGVV